MSEAAAWCDMGLYIGGTKTNIPALAELELGRGVCGVKIFAGSSTGDLMIEDDEHLEKAMRSGRRRIAFHSEDEYRLQERKPMFKSGDPYSNHMVWRDEECAFLGTRRLMALARKTGRPAHILHVSTAQELDYLKDYRDIATCEVLVNHLTQVAPDCYDRLEGFGVMNPPIRGQEHMDAAWKAVNDGTVDTIGSDHAPHPRDKKLLPWPDCPAGLTGVQTLVPIMLDHVNAGRLSLTRMVDLMCAGPARVYGVVGKGRLAAGYDADFTLVDMKRQRRIEESWIAAPCGWTPFAGMQITGWPVATIIRGQIVMRDDEVLGEPSGKLVKFSRLNPDLLIVGGGPAGIGAAVEAASLGLSVTLLDENPAPGGRIWQALETRGAKDPDDAAALVLIRRLRSSTVDAHWNATVWAIEPGGHVFWTEGAAAQSVTARTILLATGTTERPVPIPGWTLPGVMTVGAAQIALKTGGLVPGGRVWLAGQGPLLLLYATQVLDAGGRIAGVIDLSDGFAPLRALRHISMTGLPEIRRGMAWRRRLTTAGVPWIAASDLRADGTPSLQRIRVRTVKGWQQHEADVLLLHDGVIPSVQMTRAVGCAHAWNEAQRCWYPVTDDWGTTSVPGVLAAGDGTGIAGALASVLSGRIAALGAAYALGLIDTLTRDTAAAPLQAERDRHLAVRPLLDALFAPRPMRLADATLVCRCEEVSAGQVRHAARAGCLGMNQLKAYTRCGMGPCQGRMCAPVAIEVLAEARGIPVSAIEPLRTRFPVKPVMVGDLTGLQVLA